MNQRQPPHFPKSPLKGKANGSISSSELEDKVGEGADERTNHPPLWSFTGIPQGKQHPGKSPEAAEGAGKLGVLEPRDEEGAEEGGEVLGEVVVGALGAVEEVGLAVLFGEVVGGVGDGVLDARGLAGFGGEDGMEGVDEEGGGGGEEDVAVVGGEGEGDGGHF